MGHFSMSACTYTRGSCVNETPTERPVYRIIGVVTHIDVSAHVVGLAQGVRQTTYFQLTYSIRYPDMRVRFGGSYTTVSSTFRWKDQCPESLDCGLHCCTWQRGGAHLQTRRFVVLGVSLLHNVHSFVSFFLTSSKQDIQKPYVHPPQVPHDTKRRDYQTTCEQTRLSTIDSTNQREKRDSHGSLQEWATTHARASFSV